MARPWMRKARLPDHAERSTPGHSTSWNECSADVCRRSLLVVRETWKGKGSRPSDPRGSTGNGPEEDGEAGTRELCVPKGALEARGEGTRQPAASRRPVSLRHRSRRPPHVRLPPIISPGARAPSGGTAKVGGQEGREEGRPWAPRRRCWGPELSIRHERVKTVAERLPRSRETHHVGQALPLAVLSAACWGAGAPRRRSLLCSSPWQPT